MNRSKMIKACTMSIFAYLAAAAVFPQSDTQARIQALPEGLYALIETSKGDIIVSLNYAKAPLSVINFAGLAEGKLTRASVRQGMPFYDGLSFHRVINNFMIQGGCPNGDGTGDPGYDFPDEFDLDLRFDRPGLLAMANSEPATNGSQFFITQVETPWLNDMHTIFGQVTGPEDLDTVNKIAAGEGSTSPKDLILSVRIIRKGAQAEAFMTDQAAWDSALVIAEERQKAFNEGKAKEIEKTILAMLPNAVKDESGIYYVIAQKGNGTKPTQGQTLSVHMGIGLLDGELLDSTRAYGQPAVFQVGLGKVLRGLDISLMEMEVGEVRLAVFPPELAYGNQGNGPIPGDSWVYFEMELLEAK